MEIFEGQKPISCSVLPLTALHVADLAAAEEVLHAPGRGAARPGGDPQPDGGGEARHVPQAELRVEQVRHERIRSSQVKHF